MLKDSVPDSMWAGGLRDWETDAERWRIASAEPESDDADNEELKKKVLGKVSSWDEESDGQGLRLDAGVPSAARAIYTRDVNKRTRAIPKIMWGVRQFKEDAQRANELREAAKREWTLYNQPGESNHGQP
jgi:hypothetical protein